jgi:pimeloyl-ACP methyl ester carboxylesterase
LLSELSLGERTLHYERKGGDGGEPLIMIHGLGAQLVGWRPALIDALVAHGLTLILVDNRDAGLSWKTGKRADLDTGYSIGDMAADIVALTDQLDLRRFHLAGQSMGGMIAQEVVAAIPDRVASLSLIYTAPRLDPRFLPWIGSDTLPQYEHFDNRFDAVTAFVEAERESASTGFAFDEDWARTLGGRYFDRAYSPDGRARQLAAIKRWAGCSSVLAAYHRPALVIHGRADRVISYEAGLELAGLLSDSDVNIFAGMGHELVVPLIEEYSNAIYRTVKRGNRRVA